MTGQLIIVATTAATRHAMTLTWADAVVTLAMILAVIAIVWLVRHW
jgi:hypothetical protein